MPFLVLLLFALPFAGGETERVKVLYIGEPLSSPLTYFVALINDPFFDVTPVQAFTYNLPDEMWYRQESRALQFFAERFSDGAWPF